MILLFNHTDESYVVDRGERVAQLIVECVRLPQSCERTARGKFHGRGNNGLGSTNAGLCRKTNTNK